MTVRDVLGAFGRRWYAIAAVAVVAALLAASFVADSGTYTTRTIVTFRFAQTAAVASDNGTESESIIAFAGVIANVVNGGRPVSRYSSNDAPYYGAGIREGVVVGLRDEGNQWAPDFTSAMLEIQVVGRTYEWVAARQKEILRQIDDLVDAQQVGVTIAKDRISANVEPLTMQIDYVTYTRTTFLAAMAAMAAVVLIVGGGLALLLDRRRPRRSAGGADLAPSRHRQEVPV